MIEVHSLTRYYGDFAALTDVSFDVKKGEIVGLLGLNGAGKSTTLKILAGLMTPSSGRVRIDGADMATDGDSLRAKIGFLPEDPPLYRDMTVSSFLVHAGKLKGMAGADLARRLPEVIELADLGGREHQVIETLSHGFRKRVGIAAAVIHDPSLVILDEPISGLDPAQIVEMRKVVRNLGEGRAVIISSHILGEISQTCDRILVVDDGKLVAQGSEQELVGRSGREERIVITIRGDADGFEKWLTESSKVKRVVSVPANEPFAAAMVDLDGDVREAFIPELVQAGFKIRLIEAPEDELEEIFLALTHQEAVA